MIFSEIPVIKPVTPLLDTIDSPADLRRCNMEQLIELAVELRAFLLYTVGQTGGHLGANLGTVELAIALHYVFETPGESLIWDVGHQAYCHKILTGRRDDMSQLRQENGISGFLRRAESRYDHFGAGHSSTSISAALGMALARGMHSDNCRVAAIIGDGGITAGMAYEALAHAGASRANLLVVLNDNQMSISHNIGGMHNYFSRIWASNLYSSFRKGGKKILARMPAAWELARRTEEHAKGMISPGTLFEELGINYIGPIDGHDLPLLVRTIGNLQQREGPHLLHTLTVKGKGYAKAERDPVGYHSISKVPPIKAKPSQAAKKPKFQDIFGTWLNDVADRDQRIIGITPAMCEGSGMAEFASRMPQRFFDVAIAEQHAVTLGAGMACEGLKPVIAIYSTFLQRGYDQLIHDVALQNLDVLFAIDRGGLVGEDGPTHHGAFDLSYLRCIPSMVIMTPSTADETWQLLETGLYHPGPAAVRYPRGEAPSGNGTRTTEVLPIGKAAVRRHGSAAALLVFGPLLEQSLSAAEETDATVVDMRFVKPLDEPLIRELCSSHQRLITVEDNALAGGAGSAVLEFLARAGIAMPVHCVGIPDRFIEHASRGRQLESCGISAERLIAIIRGD